MLLEQGPGCRTRAGPDVIQSTGTPPAAMKWRSTANRKTNRRCPETSHSPRRAPRCWTPLNGRWRFSAEAEAPANRPDLDRRSRRCGAAPRLQPGVRQQVGGCAPNRKSTAGIMASSLTHSVTCTANSFHQRMTPCRAGRPTTSSRRGRVAAPPRDRCSRARLQACMRASLHASLSTGPGGTFLRMYTGASA